MAALLNRLRQRWVHSRFARHVGQLAGANALAQALPLLAAPLLTRLYAPADFTVLAVFTSALSLVLAFATARLDWSIPNARGNGMAAALAMLGAVALTVSAAALFMLLTLTATADPQTTALPGLASLPAWAAALLPLAVLGGGANQLLQGWQVRQAALAPVAWARLWQGVALVAVPLAVASLLLEPVMALGLVLGALAAAWVGAGALWFGATGLARALWRTTPARMRVAWRRFGGEAGWSTVASVLNTACFAVVPLLLLRHHDMVQVGWWALMQRVALGPVGLVTSAMSQGFWAEAAQLVRQQPDVLARLYVRNTRRLAWVGLAIGAVALAGPLYVGPLFGRAQWQQAGWVLAATAPLLAAMVVASPLSHLVIHGRQAWQAGWDAARLLLLVAVVELCGRAGCGLTRTVLAMSMAMALMYGVLVWLNLCALRAAERRMGAA
ncbi:MAG: hypothetical protein ACKVQR_24665 [Aquabacterium sp.]